MEHIKLFWSRVNIPTLLRECQRNLHWQEVVFLYTHYDQFDNAISTLITHSAECWKHDLFKETLKKASNQQLYKAIEFYLEEHPLLLEDLLLDMVQQVDHNRVVLMIKRADHLPLIKKYLLHVQRENISSVNEAVNDLCIKEEDFKGLRASVDGYRNFDQVALAQALENHPLLEFRRIGAYLSKINKRYKASLELSKRDKLWKDAMETVAESKDQDLAEDLARFFVEQKLFECFGACLYTCYELIRPDIVLELAWRHQLNHYVMPYMIQTFREYDTKLRQIFSKFEAQEKSEAEKEAQKKKDLDEQAGRNIGHFVTPVLAIGPPPGAMPYPGHGGGGGGGYGASPFFS
jgi:clathrin heavy chain